MIVIACSMSSVLSWTEILWSELCVLDVSSISQEVDVSSVSKKIVNDVSVDSYEVSVFSS